MGRRRGGGGDALLFAFKKLGADDRVEAEVEEDAERESDATNDDDGCLPMMIAEDKSIDCKIGWRTIAVRFYNINVSIDFSVC